MSSQRLRRLIILGSLLLASASYKGDGADNDTTNALPVWSCTDILLEQWQILDLSSVPNEGFCSICEELILPDLLKTTSCGHSFHGKCIETLFDRGQTTTTTCPCCAREIHRSSTYVCLIAQQFMSTIIHVKCHFSSENVQGEYACLWRGPLGQLHAHYSNDCQFVPLPCPLRCDRNVGRRDVDTHLLSCRHRVVDCPNDHCDWVGTFSGAGDHALECQYGPVDCPHRCTQSMALRRMDLTAHLFQCPLMPIDCRSARFGCQVRLPRGQMGQHDRDHAAYHLDLAADAFDAVERRCRDLERKVEAAETDRGRSETANKEMRMELTSLAEKLGGSTTTTTTNKPADSFTMKGRAKKMTPSFFKPRRNPSFS